MLPEPSYIALLITGVFSSMKSVRLGSSTLIPPDTVLMPTGTQ